MGDNQCAQRVRQEAVKSYNQRQSGAAAVRSSHCHGFEGDIRGLDGNRPHS